MAGDRQIVISGSDGAELYAVPWRRKFVGYLSPNGFLNGESIPDIPSVTLINGARFTASTTPDEITHIVGIESDA